jgi:Flp pilus assembly protein TadG
MTVASVLRNCRALAENASGTSAIEFAVIAPVFMLLVVGTFQFGLVISNYVVLTNAVGIGARQFSLSRTGNTPYTDTVNTVTGAAGGLTTASITVTLSVNGTACTSDGTCKTALSGGAGQPATVAATYPCSLAVYGYDFAPGCTLSASMTGMVN